MIEIGRLCIKLAGRDSGKKCVVVDVVDDNFVIIDGDVRRKRCNILHLEPLNQKLDIKKDAPHHEIVSEFKKIGIEIKERKSKPRKVRQLKLRKSKLAKKHKASAETTEIESIEATKTEEKKKVKKEKKQKS